MQSIERRMLGLIVRCLARQNHHICSKSLLLEDLVEDEGL
jgi:hypothetical protein